jgi:hypothetical protein
LITIDQVSRWARALPEVEEQDHWGHPAYRVGERLFAVLWAKERIVILKLSTDQQHELLSIDPYTFSADQWVEQDQEGWTKILLKGVTPGDFERHLERAWRGVATPNGIKAFEQKRPD